jgi:hypothetical protein
MTLSPEAQRYETRNRAQIAREEAILAALREGTSDERALKFQVAMAAIAKVMRTK